jgi:hypothetical protein
MIKCKNCDIDIVIRDKKRIALVNWNNAVTQKYINEPAHSIEKNVFIIPNPNSGFYYLNQNKIIHVIDDKNQKVVICDRTAKDDYNWFGSFKEEDIFYYPKHNVLFLTFLDGDHDYFWWWNLSTYDQDADLEKPCYYNGVFNDSLALERGDNRYAIGTLFDNDNKKVITIIFDTKTMKHEEFTLTKLQHRLLKKINKSTKHK